MRTLYEIIEGARDGIKPTHDECYYAMLALDSLCTLNRMSLDRVCENPTPIRCTVTAEQVFEQSKTAFSVSPRKWLGDNVPENKDYQAMRRVAHRVLAKVEMEQKRKEEH